MYWWDRRDYIGHSGRRRVIYKFCEMLVCTCMWLSQPRGEGGKRDFEQKKHKGAGICYFKPTLGMQIQRNGMGYGLRKKNREIIVLCSINWWVWGGCRSIKNRTERYMYDGMLLRTKIEMVEMVIFY